MLPPAKEDAEQQGARGRGWHEPPSHRHCSQTQVGASGDGAQASAPLGRPHPEGQHPSIFPKSCLGDV